MKISYDFILDSVSFETRDLVNSNFFLSDCKGGFLNLGVVRNSSKFQGYSFYDSDSKKSYKVIDEFIISSQKEPIEVKYSGLEVRRFFDGFYDKFYVSSEGVLFYSTSNSDWIELDLDARISDDFSKIGRFYNICQENGICVIEYTKKNGENVDYKVYLAFETEKLEIEEIKKWVNKKYSYSQERSSLFNLYIFKALRFKVKSEDEIIFAVSLLRDEAISKVSRARLNFEKTYFSDAQNTQKLLEDKKFERLMTANVNLAYKLSNNAIYKFLNGSGVFAGIPWFSNVWSRDELVSIWAFISNGEFDYVRGRLMHYIESIDEDGFLKIIDRDGSNCSPDSVFWLSKRFTDFIKTLKKREELYKYFSNYELEEIYNKFVSSFRAILRKNWDRDISLLRVDRGDSWMDTIPLDYPLDILVQLLGFVSNITSFARILGKWEDESNFSEFEKEFSSHIANIYFRGGNLYDEPMIDRLSCNVFLAYYFYKYFLTSEDWEVVFDNALKVMKTNWGGISSLSKKDPNFKDSYTGEDDLSYHNGDSWYWINNIAAIVLNDFNEKKYRKEINGLLLSSTKDILELGCIGFGSEISSAKEQKSQGCYAQLWSSASYIEMVDKLFKRYNPDY